MKKVARLLLLPVFLCSGAMADVIVGSNSSGPVQLYASDGTLIAPFGSPDGTAGASDGLGGMFIALPNLTSSTINDYDAAQNLLTSYLFTAPGDDRPDAPYITDLSWGASGTLWVSTYTGSIYHLAADGSVLSSFDTGTTAPGVAFDGTNLFTTEGPSFATGGPFVYERDLSGNILSTIDTGLTDTLGIGYDPASSTLWIGGIDTLSQVDMTGTVVQNFAIDGVHYGVDVQGDPASVPEPANWILFLTGIAAAAAWKWRSKAAALLPALILAAGAPSMRAAVSITSLSPNLPAPQPVGTSVTFTAAASDSDPGELRYRFRIQPPGGAFAMLSDYTSSPSVVWTPSDTNGIYQIEVSVLNRATQSTQATTASYTVSSRVTGSTPVVSPTAHPLVGLYSAPSCAAGSTMRVRFKLPSDVLWQSTALKSCNGTTSMNFYIAGMRASTSYQMRHDVITGPMVASGPILTFTTGAPGIALPVASSLVPLKAPTSTTEPVTLFAGLNQSGYAPYAVDATLALIWYAPTSQAYLTRPVPGGGYLVTYGFVTDLSQSGMRQYDLAGNLVKQTTVERVNDQLVAAGKHTITLIHHEVRLLANGNYALLAQREVASSVQGPPNDIAGDVILILDNNLQLLWSWDSFDHLDVTRAALLGETCVNPGCILFNAPQAHDWTHGNSVALTPDGNLIYSSRHQDMGYKIAYQNGAGDGHVIWRLGKDGDFAWNSTDAWPWFSHQHDIKFDDPTTISLFDDGNTRVFYVEGGNSRGQVLQVDETHMTITPLLNVDTGSYSFALGSAQRLMNGNYIFDSGIINMGANTQVTEFTSSGALVSNTHSNSIDYRAFRLRDLYSGQY